MTRGVAGRVDDAKARNLVPLAQDAADPMRGPGPQTMAQAHDAVIRLHGRAPFHRRDLGFMAGEGDAPALANLFGHALVVGMTMGQGHHA